jgi:hypothetical protein
MKSPKERYEFGGEAEEFAFKNLEREGLTVLKTKNVEKWSPKLTWSPRLDQKIGDLIIDLSNKYIFIDVKRSSISQTSLQEFKGQYYFVYNDNLTELFIFKPEDIKNGKKLSYERLDSGDFGIKLFQLKNYTPFLSLDEFILKLH